MLNSRTVIQRTRIKICGVCRPEDAALAASHGADAIGMVFHPPSPRNVSVARAREILAALPPFVTPVGLFVDAPTETILHTADELGLRHIQLHGHETPDHVKALLPLTVIKAVRVERDLFAQTLDGWRKAIRETPLPNLAGFVLETPNTAAPGGTGVPNDWSTILAAQQAGAFANLPPIIAAGGLDPQSVGEIVRTVRPYAVDVSSGIEETRGVKSAARVRAFVDAVRAADLP